MKAFAFLFAAALVVSGCNVVVKGGPLSNRPDNGQRRMYLSTGGSPRPFRTLGFVQIRGYGVSVAGVTEVGQAAIDGAIKGTLVEEAQKMGGQGVIHIEFLDENPQTPADRAAALSQSIQNSAQTGKPQIKTTDRYVTVTGEVIQFTGP